VEIAGDADGRPELRWHELGAISHQIHAQSAFHLGGDRLEPVEKAGGTYGSQRSAHFRAADIRHGCADDRERQSDRAEIHRGLGVKAMGKG
jgi:hypothetical protein